MSEPAQTDPHAAEPHGAGPDNHLLTALSLLGVVAIVASIFAIAYLTTRAPDPTAALDEERRAKVAEAVTAQDEAYGTYAVVNSQEGLFQIPVEEAMRRTVEEMRAGSFDLSARLGSSAAPAPTPAAPEEAASQESASGEAPAPDGEGSSGGNSNGNAGDNPAP